MKIKYIIPAAAALSALPAFAQSNNTDFQGFVSRGLAMYDNANYLGCIDQLSHARSMVGAIDADMSLEQVDYYLAMAKLYGGDADAEKALDKFLDDYPASLLRQDVKFSLVNIVFARHDYISALAMYREVEPMALTQARRDEYYFNLGYCQLKTAYYDQATLSFNNILNSAEYGNAARFYLAYIDYAKGDYRAAAEGFSKVNTAIAPGNMADYYLCQIYYRDGDYDRALTKARELLRSPLPVDPAYTAEAERVAGECLYRLDSPSDAIDHIRRYLNSAVAPEPSALYIIGLSEYTQGNYPKAVEYLQQVVECDPDAMTQSAYEYIGQALLHMEDYDAAIVAFNKALSLDFDRQVQEAAYYNYAVTKFKGGRVPFGNSVATFEEFLKRYPESRYADQVREYLVNGYIAESNYDSALAAIRRIAQPTPEIVDAEQYVLYNIGSRYLSSGNPAKALEYLEKAETIESGDKTTAAEVQLLIGEARYQQGNYDKAAEALLKYLSDASTNAVNRPMALYDLGYTRFRQKKYDDALTNFNRMVDKPGDISSAIVADAYNRIGDCHYYKADFDKAATAYDKAIALEPNVADYALFQKGIMSGYQRKYADKIARLNEMIERYPSSALIPDALLEITESYLRQNKTADAIATYRRLIASYPATLQARQGYLQMALTMLNSGDRKGAIEAYKEVVRLYPTSDEATQAVESLKVISAEDGTLDALSNFLSSVKGAPGLNPSETELLVFQAAEKKYLTQKATDSLEGYLRQFPGGAHAPQTLAYLMEAFAGKDQAKAYKYASQLAADYPDNSNARNALALKAETETEKGDYATALETWQKLEQSASPAVLINKARLGIVRCARELGHYNDVISAADAILSSSAAGAEDREEAIFSRGLACYKSQNPDSAEADWKTISANTDNLYGAMSAFYLAQSRMDRGDLNGARKAVETLTTSGTPHAYWLGRGFILLSDIYFAEGRDFEAREYLKALKENYPGTETDIFNMIDKRLNK